MASTPRDGSPTEPEQLREDMARTRQDLGETVDALGDKSDVKGRAQGKAVQVKEAMQGKGQQAQEMVAKAGSKPAAKRGGAAAAAAAGAGAVAILVRRRRARRQTRWQRTLSVAQGQARRAAFGVKAGATAAAPVVAGKAATAGKKAGEKTPPVARRAGGVAAVSAVAFWVARRRMAGRRNPEGTPEV